MKKKTTRRWIGPRRYYQSIFRKETRTWTHEDTEGLSEAIESQPTIAETIDSYERHALAIIEGAGYEITMPYKFSDAYPHDNGEASLSGLIEIKIRTDEKSLSPLGIALSPLGRAAQILTDCHILRQSIEAGNLENTAHHAMLLQQSVDYLNFSQWDYPANAGEAQILAPQKYSAADHALWAKRFAELRAENPEDSKRKALKIIASETGHNFESIKKFIKS
jgi:hypothetical protein